MLGLQRLPDADRQLSPAEWARAGLLGRQHAMTGALQALRALMGKHTLLRVREMLGRAWRQMHLSWEVWTIAGWYI